VARQGSAETLLMSITEIAERIVDRSQRRIADLEESEGQVRSYSVVRTVQMRQNSTYDM